MISEIKPKSFRFIFHDYNGFGTQESIQKEDIIEKNGCHIFRSKYNFKESSGDIEKNEDSIISDAFEILKAAKGSINSYKKNLIVIDNQGKKDEDEDLRDTFPYYIDDINKTIKTGNYVGVIRYKSEYKGVEATVEIGSRFDKENQSQLFLSYMISKAFDGMLFPEHSPDSSSENMWELLLSFMFVNQVKEAYKQGLFKAYRKFEYNDPKVKGTIDVNRHIKINTPFVGNIAYSLREHTHDTYVLHLVRHTFERLEKKYPKIMEGFAMDDSGVKLSNIKRQLIEVTNTYNHNNIQSTLFHTNKRISHPYFNKYEPLRKTCRMILQDMGLNIYDSDLDEQVYGVMININWLWENFVGKEIMKEIGFSHINEKTDLLVGDEGTVKKREFDFIKEKVMVIDSKYKPRWQGPEWSKLSNDIYQVLSYMFIAGVKKGGVIFPSTENAINRYNIKVDFVKDSDYFFYTIPVEIPKVKEGLSQLTAEEFRKKMKDSIEKITKYSDNKDIFSL